MDKERIKCNNSITALINYFERARMMDNNWIGNQIAMLRKKKGYTGDIFSEILGVTPQAVSKWENGKCLPETALLPKLAQTLEVTIDQLLVEREVTITKAIFSDGVNTTDITMILNQFMIGNRLHIYLSTDSLGINMKTNRVGVAILEYQLPTGAYYTYAIENTYLTLDKFTTGIQYDGKGQLEIVAAYFGTREDYRDCLSKIIHCNFFQWKKIYVDTEVFPSSPSADEIEYLTLIYLNQKGIHMISAAEKETLIYSKGKRELCIEDQTTCILPGVKVLRFEEGIDCTWAGAMTTALNYMGENYTYEQIMGMSGACYRFSFCDIWDWSATDALVSFDYASILFQALGIEAIWANRLEKNEREKERERIVADILHNKPVLAINLRIAPEWGVITGYAEGGKRLYCRTYFDQEYLNEQEEYLESDFWPFLIQHFGEKQEELSQTQRLTASLHAMVESFEASCVRGYYQGNEGFEHWIRGLEQEELWNDCSVEHEVERRLQVNDALLLNLGDARRCAGVYLKESALLLQQEQKRIIEEIAQSYTYISERVLAFRDQLNKSGKDLCYNGSIRIKMNTSLRKEQILLLRDIKEKERQSVEKSKYILECMSEQ